MTEGPIDGSYRSRPAPASTPAGEARRSASGGAGGPTGRPGSLRSARRPWRPLPQPLRDAASGPTLDRGHGHGQAGLHGGAGGGPGRRALRLRAADKGRDDRAGPERRDAEPAGIRPRPARRYPEAGAGRDVDLPGVERPGGVPRRPRPGDAAGDRNATPAVRLPLGGARGWWNPRSQHVATIRSTRFNGARPLDRGIQARAAGGPDIFAGRPRRRVTPGGRSGTLGAGGAAMLGVWKKKTTMPRPEEALPGR